VLGRELVRLHYTSSTNDIIRAAAATGRAEGLVVLAEHQTHGRGQHGRQWSDIPHQSLLCSLLLRPTHIPATHTASIINAFVAVLAQTIAHVTTAPVHIKWPNDIVVMDGTQRRKLAGVLCEARIVANQIDSICIGWGVNVHAHPQHHSDSVDLARHSSAVNEWTTQPISRADILESVWGMDKFPTARTVDNYVLRLRKLFEPDPENPRYLITVRGRGYVFRPEIPESIA
jgi:biotin-[acetyl-CoA-carboxylase] ligase BirA-like protein